MQRDAGPGMEMKRGIGPQSPRVTLGMPLGSGGEARVYEVADDSSVVAKIYRQPTPEREAKLRLMVANPPIDTGAVGLPSVAWPLDLLYDATEFGEFRGFLMPRVEAMRPLIEYYNPHRRRLCEPLFSYQYLMRTARNLATAVGEVHACGYVIGDLNQSNIMAASTALITIVDTDSFQVRDGMTGQLFRCPVGRPEYTAPEAQIGRLRDGVWNMEHDRFALAVLLFQLLMEGTHPFAAVYESVHTPLDFTQSIRRGEFPYTSQTLRQPPGAPDFRSLPPRLQRMFAECFTIGHRHPDTRPHAGAWAAALASAEAGLVICEDNHQHLHSLHLVRCPWCARRQRFEGLDAFPSVASVRAGTHLTAPGGGSL